MTDQRKRIGRLDTIGSVLLEHSKVYKELRRGRITPALASRLSQLLVNHRSMLEVAILEKQIEEMRQLLASERSVPILTMHNKSSDRTADNGHLTAS
jgi:hypothetical protein